MKPEEYYKEQYFYELARRDALLNELNLPFALLAGLTGALVKLPENLPLLNGEWGCISVVVLIACAVVLFVAAYFLWNCWAEKKNYYPANAEDIKKYEDELVEFYKANNHLSSIEEAQNKLSAFILREYIRCAAANADSNLIRANNLKSAKRWLLVGGFLVAIGYVIDSVDTWIHASC